MSHGVKLDGLSMEDLKALIDDAQKALAVKVDAKRAELQKELAALDAISKPAQASKSAAKRSTARHDEFEGENGETWSGRGGVPKWGAKYGATTREQMERFRKYSKA